MPKTLRILVDLTHLLPEGEGGGIKPTLQQLFAWLGRQAGGDFEFIYLTNAALTGEITSWLRASDRLVSLPEAGTDLAAREKCDLVYCPFGITDWACPGIPTITLMVDLLHKDFPESLSPPDRDYRETCCRAALRHTDLFQVISDYTGGQMLRHYLVEPERIVRTHLPIHGRLPGPDASGRARESQPYFFYPANAWAHKNHDTLLAAYALYLRIAGAAAWRLVLTGHANAQMLHLKEIAKLLGLSTRVDFLGYVDELRLAALWDAAGALIFPSLHEGFGIPLLEAMARGVPILASNATAIPEITAGAALLVDGRAPHALAHGMMQMAGNPELRQDLVERGRRRVADFSPEAEFGRLLQAFYSTAAQEARWRQHGYHAVDGLIEPRASFALPRAAAAAELRFATRPLGIARTLEFWSGSNCLASFAVAPHGPTEGRLPLPADARVLTLRVPDATRLSASDPRTHGVLLEKLHVAGSGGFAADLLAGSPA